MSNANKSSDWQSTSTFCAWSIVAAFCTYFCMYAFRKPFTAGFFLDAKLGDIDYFLDTKLGDLDYKTVLVISQVFGYTLSKFIGIKVVSEITAARRAQAIAVLIATAEVALIVFALVPPPWNFPALFVNGLSLGMVFGMVLAYLEGRRLTEALTAGLCASFVVSSGVVKSVGSYLIEFGVSEYWMPATTGLIFAPPLFISIWMLTRIPPPNPDDIEHRSERVPLNREDRWRFFRRYSVGLSLLVIVYVALTTLRSVRDDFAVEIWRDLSGTTRPAVFAQTETIVMIAVVTLNAATFLIVRNRTAFMMSLMIVIAGFGLVAGASILQTTGMVGPFMFMVLSGIGLYTPYIAFHTTVFERMIAASKNKANLGFLMYLADSSGYLGYVAVMLTDTFTDSKENMLGFFITMSYVVSAASIVGILLAIAWFRRSLPNDE
ncbi:MAG: hypothetical protein CMJ78_19515 [Planctomycetaceae bacterium]|nr:hypothetical protein [Planctomycetaceae bacterium]